MADGDVYKVTLEWRYAAIDVAVQNVLWFRQAGDMALSFPPESVLGLRLRDTMPAGTNWAGEFKAWLDGGFSILNVRVQKVWPDVASAYVTPVNIAGTGTNGPTYVPAPCALLVRLRSTLNTRRGHGRLYLGGIASAKGPPAVNYALANPGYWGAGVRAAADLWIASLRDAALVAPAGEPTFEMGVWSKTVAGPSPPYAFAWNELVSWEVTSAVRIQRRREVGVGI